MPGQITRKPLFDEAEKQRITQTLASLELDAEEWIEREPERREEILQRLRQVSAEFIRKEVRSKRKETVVLGLGLLVVGIVIVALGGADSKGAVMLGGSFLISGIITAFIAAIQMMAA